MAHLLPVGDHDEIGCGEKKARKGKFFKSIFKWKTKLLFTRKTGETDKC